MPFDPYEYLHSIPSKLPDPLRILFGAGLEEPGGAAASLGRLMGNPLEPLRRDEERIAKAIEEGIKWQKEHPAQMKRFFELMGR